jgi:hypothetical protein
MAFTGRTALQPRGYGVWIYKTTDSAATVNAANYFLNAWDVLEVGDRILTTIVTGIYTAAEAYVGSTDRTVTARSSSAVTTAAMSTDITATIPAEFVFTSAGTTGEKKLAITTNYSGNAGKWELRVAAAGGDLTNSPLDEALGVGYNVVGTVTAEPQSGLYQENNWKATARGATYQRTMEAYFQFAGASPADNVARPFFFSFEPGDTSRGGSHKGEILYAYLSTGFNRCGTTGGGGLTIATSLAENVGGGAVSLGQAFFDVDGCRLDYLHSCPDIQRITGGVSTDTAMTWTVAAGHNIKAGARIQIWKPDDLGSYTPVWNGGAAVVGTITSATTTVLTTNINNTSLGVVGGVAGIGYGWSLVWSPVAAYHPTFLGLYVGTGAPYASLPYQMEVVGTSGFKGTVGILEPAYAVANPNTAAGDLGASLIYMLSNGAASAGGRRQIISSYNGTVGWSIGYPDDATGNNLDDYLCAIGAVQGTDSNFTVGRSSITFCNDGTNGYVGIGGTYNFGETKLSIAAGTSTVAQIRMIAGTAKTTPLAGEMCYDGTNFKICKSAGTWANVTAI